MYYTQDILIEQSEAKALANSAGVNGHAEAEMFSMAWFDHLGHTNPVKRPDNLFPLGAPDGVIPIGHRPSIHPFVNPSNFLDMPAEHFNVIVEDQWLGQQFYGQVGRTADNGAVLIIPGKIANHEATLNVSFGTDLSIGFMTLYCYQGYYSVQQLMTALPEFRAKLNELLPVVSGMLYAWNTRGHQSIMLGPKKPMQVRGIVSGVSVLQINRPGTTILNPRHNPTGITRSPHIRAGHWRTLSDGTQVWVSESVIHEDIFIPGQHDQRTVR